MRSSSPRSSITSARFPPHETPKTPMIHHPCFLLHSFLAESAARSPDAIAVVCDGQRIAYRDLDRRSNALAHALVARGVARGDRVVILGDNTLDTAVAFWAVLKASAVVSILHPQTRPAKLAYLLHDCRARALIADHRLEAAFAEPARSSSHLATVLITGAAADPRGAGACERLAALPRLTVLDDAIAGAPQDAPPPRRCIDVDLAAIIYTSGSTGEPKGVMLSHRNMVAATASIASYLEIARDDVILCVLPLAFDYGLYQMILAFSVGARVVLERSFAFPAEVMRTVEAERVTGFPGVPTMFATLLAMDSLASYDLSAIRYFTSTAAALPVKHIEQLRRRFPAAKIFSMYGLTECKRCTYLPPEDLARKPGSIGIAIPNTELWLIDSAGRRVGPGEIGQVVIRGATVMQGYWNDPEETACKLRPGPLPGERVLHTGDLGRLDDEGYLYFAGRMDDVIKSRGEKVAPAEVEAALLAIPGVREAAVVGVPDPVLGEAIKAFVVTDDGVTLDEAAIRRACAQQLESTKVP